MHHQPEKQGKKEKKKDQITKKKIKLKMRLGPDE